MLATVGREPVYAREVERLLKEATGGHEIDSAAEALVRAQVLWEIVGRRLVLAYARRTGSGASDADVEAALRSLKSRLAAQGRFLDDYLQEESLTEADLTARIAWPLTWRKCLNRYVTDERIAACFEANRRGLDGTELSVSHVLLRADGDGPAVTDAVLEEAKDLRRAIVAGDVSFAEAARQHSVAPSAEDGGRLGFIKRHGAMDEAFSRAAFGLDVGRVSEPVRTRFGVHLIRCDEMTPGTKGLDDVREQVVEALARELLEKLARLEARHTPVKFTGAAPYFKPGTRELVVPQP